MRNETTPSSTNGNNNNHHHHNGGEQPSHQYGMRLRRTASRLRLTRSCPNNTVCGSGGNTNNNNTTANGGGGGTAAGGRNTPVGKTRKVRRKRAAITSIPCKTNKRCLCLPQSYSPVEFPPIWTEFRAKSQLCDGVIRCEDGVEFRIHRAIVSAVSPYFKALFTNSINRNQPEQREAFMKAPSDLFRQLLDFAYTGSCDIRADNVEGLLRVADQYECLGVVQLCCQFILNQLQPSNCLGILRFARHYFCKDLELRGRRYIRQNFTELLQSPANHNDFELLDLKDLLEILRDDELNVKTEDTVFDAIRRWVEYKPSEREHCIMPLLKCMRLGTMSLEYVRSLYDWLPIQRSRDCLEYIAPIYTHMEQTVAANNGNEVPQPTNINHYVTYYTNSSSGAAAVNYNNNYRSNNNIHSNSYIHSSNSIHNSINNSNDNNYNSNNHNNNANNSNDDDDDAHANLREVMRSVVLRPRVPHDILFAVGGWSAGSPTNFIETYDTRADRWLLSRDSDAVPRAYHGLCTLRGLIYMIGGFDGNEHFNTVRCFDPVTHCWRECACMYYPRCYVSVVMHANKIYAMGGYNGRIRMNSAERYDPERNQWELISPMQKQRSDASAAVLGDKIYIVGGFNGQEVMSSAEMYDILTDQWSYIPPMISARSGVSLVAFRNALYALGGFNGFTRLTTGEKYQPFAAQTVGPDAHCGGGGGGPSANSTNTSTSSAGGANSGTSNATWIDIAEMFSSRSNFATVILDDLIFVIGGFNDRFVAGSTTINYVECYDAEADEWFDAAPMNLNRSALAACVISGLPNGRDYSYVGRTETNLTDNEDGGRLTRNGILNGVEGDGNANTVNVLGRVNRPAVTN